MKKRRPVQIEILISLAIACILLVLLVSEVGAPFLPVIHLPLAGLDDGAPSLTGIVSTYDTDHPPEPLGGRLEGPGHSQGGLEVQPHPVTAGGTISRIAYDYRTRGDVPAAVPAGTGEFTYPTISHYVSGWTFLDRRNPTHIGLDLACREGDPIRAADTGSVVIADWHGGYGLMVEIDHGNGYHTRYGHFSQLNVKRGQVVFQGDLLGRCGNTGFSSGPHLHFEIRDQGVPRNPRAYLPRPARRVRASSKQSAGGEIQVEDQGWLTQFFNSEDLSGPPVFTHHSPWIGAEWGIEAPAPGVWPDGFSVRWTRRVRLEAGQHRFCAMSDDGARIWVDGTLVLDEWHANNGIVYCGRFSTWAGVHNVKVEYYEHGGQALIYVWWEAVTD